MSRKIPELFAERSMSNTTPSSPNASQPSGPRRLGYRLDRNEADDIDAPAEMGLSMVWIFP